MALTQSQMIAAVADRAEMSRAGREAGTRRARRDRPRGARECPEGPSRRARSADGARQARHQEAHRTQPGDRRGDHDRGQAGERRRPSATVGEGEGGASVGAEGAAAARGVKRPRLAVAPARLDQRPNAKPDKRRLRGPRQRMRSFGVTAPRVQPQPPLSRPTIRDGRPRRPTSSFCATWLSSTSGSQAVATPNGRRTRPQQIEGRSLATASTRQFSHPRIAVRIRQSPASLPAVVPSSSDAGVDAGGCYAGRATATRACKSPRIGLRASTSACPATTESGAACAPVTAPGGRRPGDAHFWRIRGAWPRARRDPLWSSGAHQ